VKIGSEDEKLDAIGGERGFEGFEVDAESTAGFGMSANRNAEATGTNAVEDGGSAGISGVFKDDSVAGAHEGFGDKVERLLAAIGDQQRVVLGRDAVLAQKLEHSFFERGETVGGTEVENVLAVAAERGVGAGLQLLDRKKLRVGAGHHKIKSVIQEHRR
jgi:hypothetical protein